jgi:hypothetical protein
LGWGAALVLCARIAQARTKEQTNNGLDADLTTSDSGYLIKSLC